MSEVTRTRGQQTFSVKGTIINILGFVGYTVSVKLLNSFIVAGRQPERIHKQMAVSGFEYYSFDFFSPVICKYKS